MSAFKYGETIEQTKLFFCILIFLFNISSFLHLTIHTIIYIHVQKTTRILQVQETLYLVRILNYNFQKEEIYNL